MVDTIIDDQTVQCNKVDTKAEFPPNPMNAKYKVLPKIDQHIVFDKVYKLLAKNGTIGIFPEGGSTDMGHLLPLKAGVTIMALGSAVQGTEVRIVPVGLTYLHAHKFRSKAVVQFGKPFRCPPRLIEMYKTDPKKACGELLEKISAQLMKVTVNTANWKEKKELDHVRRLYQPDLTNSTTGLEFMARTKKFTNGFEKAKGSKQAMAILEEVREYMADLVQAGWKDKELKLIRRGQITHPHNA